MFNVIGSLIYLVGLIFVGMVNPAIVVGLLFMTIGFLILNKSN